MAKKKTPDVSAQSTAVEVEPLASGPVAVRNCLNCGKGYRDTEVWCPQCQASWPAAWFAILNPTTDTPEIQKPVDIVLQQAFFGPAGTTGGLQRL